MRKNYAQLTRNVNARLNPENILLEKSFTDELSSISYSDVLVYVRNAMKGVEPEYTKRSREAGERVKEHLKSVLTDVIYKYQGSVMTNTHIKGFSDIDLLTISDKFYTWDSSGVSAILESFERMSKFGESSINKLQYEKNATSYTGNMLDDLRTIRMESEHVLSDKYMDCDTTKPKAIKINNRNLNREVDIVTANWYDDVSSIINSKGEYRGIQVYNKQTHQKGKADYPFLSISQINERSSSTGGRLKKMIRFLKQSKADSQYEIILSSFDINAVCYDIAPHEYQTLSYLGLVPILYRQLKRICEDDSFADNIISVDGREYIFRNQNEKKRNLRLLLGEIESIYLDLYEKNHV